MKLSAVPLQLSGMPIQAYFQKHIFDPLGMKETYYDVTNGQVGSCLGPQYHFSFTQYAAYVSVRSFQSLTGRWQTHLEGAQVQSSMYLCFINVHSCIAGEIEHSDDSARCHLLVYGDALGLPLLCCGSSTSM